MKQLTGLLLLFFLAVGVVSAQTAPTTAMPPQHQATTVQAAHFDVEAATNAYMAELSPAQRARSDAYFEGGYWLILWDLLIALAWRGCCSAPGFLHACVTWPNGSPACAGCRRRSTW